MRALALIPQVGVDGLEHGRFADHLLEMAGGQIGLALGRAIGGMEFSLCHVTASSR
jgi:hypothetical protein